MHQKRVEKVDLGVKNEREEPVFRERARTELPNEEGRRTVEIASETGFSVCTNRNSGCDQKFETRNRLAGLT